MFGSLGARAIQCECILHIKGNSVLQRSMVLVGGLQSCTRPNIAYIFRKCYQSNIFVLSRLKLSLNYFHVVCWIVGGIRGARISWTIKILNNI
jgi:hypothetical protein